MNLYRIARIVNTYGIQGEIKVLADTSYPDQRFQVGNQLGISPDGKSVLTYGTVASYRLHKGSYLIKFQEFNDINQVEAFKGYYLTISQDQQHELPEDTYYYHQIIGLKVVTDQGQEIGQVSDILELAANDVWVVKRPDKKKPDALIPFIEDVVKEIDLDQGLVTIELMEGLIDDED